MRLDGTKFIQLTNNVRIHQLLILCICLFTEFNILKFDCEKDWLPLCILSLMFYCRMLASVTSCIILPSSCQSDLHSNRCCKIEFIERPNEYCWNRAVNSLVIEEWISKLQNDDRMSGETILAFPCGSSAVYRESNNCWRRICCLQLFIIFWKKFNYTYS